MSDWYSNRVAAERGQPRPPSPPPVQYPQHPGQNYQQTQYPPQYPQYPQYPQQPQQPQQPQVSDADFIKAGRTGNAGITPMDVLERSAMKGGKGTRVETELCPECGSNHFFQRKGSGKMGMAPAPYCHSCGYNGIYEQYGAMDVPLTEDKI